MATGEFHGRIALVTGGSRGFGAVISESLARSGARVIVNHLWQKEVATALCRRINDDPAVKRVGGMAVGASADVSDAVAVDNLFTFTGRVYGGPPTILVNHAGMKERMELHDPCYDRHWSRTIRTNLFGTKYVTRRAYCTMREQGGGHILFVSDFLPDERDAGGYSAYAAAEGGLAVFAKQIALEGWASGIVVNTLLLDPEVRNRPASTAPGVASLEDVAAAAVRLCSDPDRTGKTYRWKQQDGTWGYRPH